jgi:hypothetical protein
LTAGGSCDGECKGSCEYTPPEGGCQAGASAKCEASGSASVECSGKCDGEVTPPDVSVECEATAKAEAEFAAECHPPSVDVKYNLSAEARADFAADASAEAAFQAKIQAIGKAFANIAAKGAKIEGVLRAGGGLVEAGAEAVTDAAGNISANADVRAFVGAYCALDAIPVVVGELEGAVDNLSVTLEAVGEVGATFGS